MQKEWVPKDGFFFKIGLLALLLTLGLGAQGAENLPLYYPSSLRHALSETPHSPQIRKLVFNVLSQAHLSNGNSPDELRERCPKSSKCYQHNPLPYTYARQVLFGRLHLQYQGGHYSIKGVYCSKEWRDSEFPRGKGPAPGQIPDHRVMNTEHTWPQSRFSSRFPKDLQKGDLHILFPVEASVNSLRSNLPFGEVEKVSSSPCPEAKKGHSSQSRVVFEPANEHKGNVARALFYFSVRYDIPIDLEQEQTLRRWNQIDPVDEAEQERNSLIFEIQGNRNPFIDYPQLSEIIENF